MHSSDISAYIIAGGKSSRFGEDKALFMYRGRPLIEYVIEAIRPVITRITIVGDNAERFAYLGLPTHADLISGMGAFGGVYTALQKTETQWIFAFACDMPNLDTGLIRYMTALDGNYDVAVPLIDGFYEPLHALYSRSCLAPVETQIRDGNRQIIRFFNNVTIRPVTEGEIRVYTDPERVFKNINYRNDVKE